MSRESSQRRFAGKVVAVTGGARGIGRNIAKAFGGEGAFIGLADIDQEKGNTAVSELRGHGVTAEFLHVDLSRRGEPQAMVRNVVERFGRLDVLINNARSGGRNAGSEEDEDAWEVSMAVTLRAAFFASQEAVRVMKKNGGGSIVNISSTTALLAAYEVSATYQIAKAGMIQMTRHFALKVGPHNVRVNAVLPGFIVQDEHRHRFEQDDNQRYREIAEFSHPVRHTGASDDVANACLFLCSPDASFINGQCLVVDGGMSVQEHFSLLSEFQKKT